MAKNKEIATSNALAEDTCQEFKHLQKKHKKEKKKKSIT